MRRLTALAASASLFIACTAGAGSSPAASAIPALSPGTPSATAIVETPSTLPSTQPEPIATLAPSCPPGVLSVAELAAADLDCYGSRDVTVLGWIGDPPIMGWEVPYIAPRWLWIPDVQGRIVALWQVGPTGTARCQIVDPEVETPAPDAQPCRVILLHFAPVGVVSVPGKDGLVRVTGHRMDPAAEQCHYTYQDWPLDWPTWSPTETRQRSAEARHICREAFVVTSIQEALAPPASPGSA